MTARFGIVGLVFAVGLVACGSQDPASDGGVDAGVDSGVADSGVDAGLPDAGTDAGLDAGSDDAGSGDAGMSCSGFATDAGAVAQMFVRAITPVGTGGTIVDGVYDLTEWSVYTGTIGASGPTGVMVSATQVIQGGVYKYNHRATQDDAGFVLDTSGTFTTPDGGALVAQQTCPPGPQPLTSYTTDGTTLVFYSLSPPWGLTFTRR